MKKLTAAEKEASLAVREKTNDKKRAETKQRALDKANAKKPAPSLPPKEKPAKKGRAKKLDEPIELRPIDPSLPRKEQEAQAAIRIANASALVEQVEGELSKVRREWAELVAKHKVGLKASIESELNDATKKVQRILSAHQSLEEAEAGRRVALHELLDRRTRIKKVLRDAFTNAQQMEFNFGGIAMPPDEKEKTVEQLTKEDDEKMERSTGDVPAPSW